MNTKTCKSCNKAKTLSNFHKDNKCSDGHRNVCKSCKLDQAAILKSQHIPDDMHGKVSTYKKRGCRCDLCIEEMRKIRREQAAKTRNPSYWIDRVITHGTLLGYSRAKCRCVACSEASHQYESSRWKSKSAEELKDFYARAKIHKWANRRKRRGLANKLTAQDRQVTRAYMELNKESLCYYCGKESQEMQWDHFFPIKLGGTNYWFNLKRSCKPCNQRKSGHCGTWNLLRYGESSHAHQESRSIRGWMVS